MTKPEAAQIIESRELTIAERLDLYRTLLGTGVLTVTDIRRHEGLGELPS
jgi:hypothetical protein